MFSVDNAFKPDVGLIPNFRNLFDKLLTSFCEDQMLSGALLCQYEIKTEDLLIKSAVNIPDSPFNGSDKRELIALLNDCFSKYSKPHIHSLHNSGFWRRISSLIDTSSWQPSVLYFPVFVRNKAFILIGFIGKAETVVVNEDLNSEVTELMDKISYILLAEETTLHLKILEFYVKEVGHDIASSVQAIIAKLRNVSNGLLEGKMAIQKIKETEKEIMSTYRIADTLGITVDPDYNLNVGDDFDLSKTVNTSIQLCLSEASERHIEIRPNFSGQNFSLWGDERAIQSAITQLLINGIKYGRGASFVEINVRENDHFVELSVTDKGIPINDEDGPFIWDFGYRGSNAKEAHVNGSGIGLYTVKKIVEAHGGSVGFRNMSGRTQIVTFFMKLPKKALLNKTKLL